MNGDEAYSVRPVARWYMPAAIASLVWYLLGCANYLYQVTLDPATLAADQRAMIQAAPSWMYAAFAVAVWVGLAHFERMRRAVNVVEGYRPWLTALVRDTAGECKAGR